MSNCRHWIDWDDEKRIADATAAAQAAWQANRMVGKGPTEVYLETQPGWGGEMAIQQDRRIARQKLQRRQQPWFVRVIRWFIGSR